MTPFFSTPGKCAALSSEIERWIGTKFIDKHSQPGVGADCVGFVTGVLRNLGALKAFAWPDYTVNGGPAMLPVFLAAVKATPQLEALEAGAIPSTHARPGDVVLIANRKMTHICLFERETVIWHCWPCCGVIRGNVHDPLAKRCCQGIWRPVVIAT